MNYFGIDPDTVHAGASAMNGSAATAASVATKALSDLHASSGVVVHPVLAAAFTKVADDSTTLHHSVGPAVASFANSIAKGGNTIVDAQNESSAVQRGVIGVSQTTQSALSRPLTS